MALSLKHYALRVNSMDDDGALPQGTNTNLHRMVTNLSGQARVRESISLN